MSALVTGFHHIALYCKDVERSLALYRALGFADKKSWGEGDSRAFMLETGGSCVELFAGGKDVPDGKWVHLALKTPDCDAAYSAALAAGAAVKIEPKDVDIPAHSGPYPVRIAFVTGPDGEIIELFQER